MTDGRGGLGITEFGKRVRTIMETNQPDGYKFVIYNKKGRYDEGAGGFERTAVDPPAMYARVNNRQLIASLSKLVTAAAVLNRLQAKGLSPDEPVHKFLPPDFAPGPVFKTLTFLDFLNMRTGYDEANQPGGGTLYPELKTIVASKPNLPTKTTTLYLRFNYAVMRVVLPMLDLYDPKSKMIWKPAGSGTPEWYAERYIAIVNQHVLAPLGIPPAGCQPNTLAPRGLVPASAKKLPVLAYPYKTPGAKGAPSWDYTPHAGAGGWFLSADEVGRLLHSLYFEEKILNAAMKAHTFPAALPGKARYGAGAWCTKVGNRNAYSHGAMAPFGQGLFGGFFYLIPQEEIAFVALTNAAGHPTEPNWGDVKWPQEFVSVYGPG